MSEKTIDILSNVGTALGILLAGWILISIIASIEKKTLKKSKLDDALHLFIIKGTKAVLWIVLFVMVLTQLKVNTTPLVAVVGAGGAAIALALKDSLGNIAGGMIILMNKPFGRGDTIEIAGMTGVVDSIDLLMTHLHTFDNKAVTIPNGTITTSILMNYSKENMRRVDCTFRVSYGTDVHQAKELLASVAKRCPDVVHEPEPIIGVSSNGDNGISLDLKVWCSTEKYYDTKYFLEENVKLAFDEAGILIPYPQMDIHIRQNSAKS